MTDPRLDEPDVGRALAALREEVRRQAAPATALAVRRLAERRRYTRRAGSALAAAAAVAAVVAGGLSVVRGQPQTAPEPADPTVTAPATPTPSPLGFTPTPPRTDPAFRGVGWVTAKIELPAHPGCPRGQVRLRGEDQAGQFASGVANGDRITVDVSRIAYGDLTGDGVAEAVLVANCQAAAQDSADGAGQLLVIRRSQDGSLHGLGWAGPRGALFADWWIKGGRLYTDVKPWPENWGYSLGAARGYRWQGETFAEVDATSEFPGLVPVGARAGAAADLGPVIDQLACAGGDVPDRSAPVLRLDALGRGAAAGTTWDATQPLAPDSLPHLVDLAGDGHRRLLIALSCGPAGPVNIVLLDRVGAGYRAVAVAPAGARSGVGEWRYADGVLTVSARDGSTERTFRWDGRAFVPR